MGNRISFVDFLQVLADKQAEVRISWGYYDWIKRKFDEINRELDVAQVESYMDFTGYSQGLIEYVGEDFIYLVRPPESGSGWTLPRIIPIEKINGIDVLSATKEVAEALA